MSSIKNYLHDHGLEATQKMLLHLIEEENKKKPLEARPLRLLELKTLPASDWDKIINAVQASGHRELHQELLFTRLELKKAGF